MLTDSSLQVRRIPSHLDVSGIHRCLFFLALICGLLRFCTLSKMTPNIFGICTCLQSGWHKQQFQDQGNSAVLRPAFTGRPSQSSHVCCFPAVASRLISFSPPCTLQKAILIYSDWLLKDTHSSAESWKSFLQFWSFLHGIEECLCTMFAAGLRDVQRDPQVR